MVLASAAQGQDAVVAAVPCRETACVLVVDWGVGKTMNDMPPDRRYGAPADFENTLRQTLQAHKMTALASMPDGKVSIRVQAVYKTRVLCDNMGGTTPDKSCATIGGAVVNFSSSEPGAKLPTSMQVTNRCGASESMMSMGQFGKFVGDMIWWIFEGQQQRVNKPMGKC